MNKKSSLLLLGLYVNLFCTNRAIRIDELYPFVYSGHNIAKGSLKSYLENEQSAGGYWCITAHSHCIPYLILQLQVYGESEHETCPLSS